MHRMIIGFHISVCREVSAGREGGCAGWSQGSLDLCPLGHRVFACTVTKVTGDINISLIFAERIPGKPRSEACFINAPRVYATFTEASVFFNEKRTVCLGARRKRDGRGDEDGKMGMGRGGKEKEKKGEKKRTEAAGSSRGRWIRGRRNFSSRRRRLVEPVMVN